MHGKVQNFILRLSRNFIDFDDEVSVSFHDFRIV